MELKDLQVLEYTADMGAIRWPAGFAQSLEGKTIAQQLKRYRVIDWGVGPLSYYLINWATYSGLEELEQYAGWEKLILRDGLVVGFVCRGSIILPYGVVDADSRSDNNGAGYKERTVYSYLVCVPEQLDRARTFAPPFGGSAPELTVPVIPYDGSRGGELLPEELAARLEGKPLSAQMYYFAVHECNPSEKAGWEDTWHKYASYYLNDLCMHRGGYLPFRDDVVGLIVHEDKIVGVRIRLGDVDDAPTADLYPYEVQVCWYRYSYTETRYPRKRQLIGMPLPG